MIFRKLTIEDAFVYHKLRLQSLQEIPEAFAASYQNELQFSLEKIAQRIEATNERFVLGAFVEQQLIGIVGFYQEYGTKVEHRGNLFGMYVLPPFRKQCVGKNLLQESFQIIALDYSKIEQIYLIVSAKNAVAKALYKNAGFLEYGCDRKALKWENCYYDELLMVKYLKGGN